MKPWTVHFNPCAHTLTPTILLTYLDLRDGSSEIVSYAWLLSNGACNVVVDTGFKDLGAYNAQREEKRKWHADSGDGVKALLEAHALTPEDVDHVVLSHLHYDHCSHVDLFPSATIHVAEKEWLHVMAPTHRELTPSPLFPRDTFAYLADQAWDRLRLVTGERELAPGITLLPVGGHTPGTMAVLVSTAGGKVAIASDNFPLFSGLDSDKPTGMFCNVHECFAALKMLKQKADLILPSHDPKLLTRYPQRRV